MLSLTVEACLSHLRHREHNCTHLFLSLRNEYRRTFFESLLHQCSQSPPTIVSARIPHSPTSTSSTVTCPAHSTTQPNPTCPTAAATLTLERVRQPLHSTFHCRQVIALLIHHCHDCRHHTHERLLLTLLGAGRGEGRGRR